MLHVALCDDDPQELERIKALLQAYIHGFPEHEISFRSFTSMESLLTEIECRSTFDLLLLDICLPDKSGIDAARELRAAGSSVPIIFLTTSREYAVEAYAVEALQYLIKPVSQPEFFRAMNRAMERISLGNGRYFVFKSDGELHRILLQEIVYSEAQGNYQCLHMVDGSEWSLRMTVGELFDSLSRFPDFARCGTPYIVNLQHVSDMSRKQLRMDTGRTLWIPRGAFAALKEQYFRFYCGEGEAL